MGTEVVLAALAVVATLAGGMVWLNKKLFAQNDSTIKENTRATQKLSGSIDKSAAASTALQKSIQERDARDREFHKNVTDLLVSIKGTSESTYEIVSKDAREERLMTQLALFPMKYLNVTQRYGAGTHVGGYAIDIAGKDSGIDDVYAPFDCVVKKIWPNGNTVWFQSLAPVLCADGSTSTVTVAMTHDNSVAALSVGKKFKQGDVIYQEGTAGQATGNHVHLEASKKPFSDTGWHKNAQGYWVINDGAPPESVFWLRNVIRIDTGGLAWKSTTEGGNDVAIIKDTKEWYARCNKTHQQIRGRDLSRTSFLSFVGKDFLKFAEKCSDDPEADAVYQAQNLGQRAIAEHWEQRLAAQGASTELELTRDSVLGYINEHLT